MSDGVQFDEDVGEAIPGRPDHFLQTHPSTSTRFITKITGGFVANEYHAAVILLAVAALMFGFSVFILMNTGKVRIPDSQRPHNNGKDFIR